MKLSYTIKIGKEKNEMHRVISTLTAVDIELRYPTGTHEAPIADFKGVRIVRRHSVPGMSLGDSTPILYIPTPEDKRTEWRDEECIVSSALPEMKKRLALMVTGIRAWKKARELEIEAAKALEAVHPTS